MSVASVIHYSFKILAQLPMSTTIIFRVPDDLATSFNNHVEEKGLAKSRLLRKLLSEYMDKVLEKENPPKGRVDESEVTDQPS